VTAKLGLWRLDVRSMERLGVGGGNQGILAEELGLLRRRGRLYLRWPVRRDRRQDAPERDDPAYLPLRVEFDNVPSLLDLGSGWVHDRDTKPHPMTVMVKPAGDDRAKAWMISMNSRHFFDDCVCTLEVVVRAKDLGLLRPTNAKELSLAVWIRLRPNFDVGAKKVFNRRLNGHSGSSCDANVRHERRRKASARWRGYVALRARRLGCLVTYSLSTPSMRACQPWPVLRKYASTSGL
jgi:hypothetical protein